MKFGTHPPWLRPPKTGRGPPPRKDRIAANFYSFIKKGEVQMNRVAQDSPAAAMRLAAWAAGLLLFGAAFNNAYGAGTTAGTDVSNSATVDYSVGGVAQPQASSNIVTFE